VVALAGIAWLLLVDGDDDTDDANTDTASENDEGADPEAETAEADEGQTYDPERLTGTWEGSYECAYGAADLTLTIDDYPQEEGVGAGWAVSPAGGSDAPEGLFFLQGTYADGELSLEAQEPAETVEVAVPEADWHDLEADLSDRESTEVIEAEVVGDGCGEITLERTATDPWYVGSWQGQYGCSQGTTGATISIEATGPDEVDAFFEFYDIGETNEGYEAVPYGSMNMNGWYEDRELTLTLTNWVEGPPPNYAAVDIVSLAEAEVNPDTFVGSFPSEPGCSIFGLERVEDGTTYEEGAGAEAGEDEDAPDEEGTG
jgi:hypothetical protein